MATRTDDRELLAQLVAIGVQAREHPAAEFGLAWEMLLARRWTWTSWPSCSRSGKTSRCPPSVFGAACQWTRRPTCRSRSA